MFTLLNRLMGYKRCFPVPFRPYPTIHPCYHELIKKKLACCPLILLLGPVPTPLLFGPVTRFLCLATATSPLFGPVSHFFCLAPCHLPFTWSRAIFSLLSPVSFFFYSTYFFFYAWPRATFLILFGPVPHFFCLEPCHFPSCSALYHIFFHLVPCHFLFFGPVSYFFAWPRATFFRSPPPVSFSPFV